MTAPARAASAAQTGLLAGAGSAEIAVGAGGFPVDGFTAQRDPLLARVLLLDNGSRRIALVVVDLTSLPAGSVARLQAIVGQAGGVRAADVLVGVSHTFSAPHIGPLSEDAVAAAVASAAAAAVGTIRSARVGYGTGICRVAVNRVVRTRDGYWHGADDGGLSDPSLAVVKIVDTRGQPVALLLNYAVQSSVMHEAASQDGGLTVTGDLAGEACRYVERQYPGAVALFGVGAAGDQAPYLTANRYTSGRDGSWARADVGDAGYLLVQLLGERLGGEAVRVSERVTSAGPGVALSVLSIAATAPAQRIAPSAADIRPAVTYDFRPAGTAEIPIWVARIGDIVLVCLQAELSAATGIAVKDASPHPRTLVLTMVNGGAKYLPDVEAYDRVSYQAMNSRYGRGAAETVAAKIGQILHDIKEQG